MKVLLSAYACDPLGASEAANAWFTASGLALDDQVTILTTNSMRGRVEQGVREVRERGGNLSAYCVSDEVPHAARLGMTGTLLRYAAWQRRIPAWMSDHDNGPWDVAHHSSWGSATLPVGIAYGPYPFTLGPIGGGQRLLRDLREWFDGPLLENRLRDASLESVRVNPFARKALGTASAVLVTNSQTMKLVAPLSRRADPELCLAEGIPDDRVLLEPIGAPSTPHIVWLGRFLPRKAASLAVRAFAPLARAHPDVTMSLVGDGPTRLKTESLVHDLGISHRVRFLGSLPWVQAQEVLAGSTAHLFTSVRDSSSAQTLEAAALGVPTVTLALAGARDFLRRPGFVLVDPHPGQQLPCRIAEALAEVLRWPLGRRRSESLGALQFARENTWSVRTARLRETLRSACDRPPTPA